MAIRAYLEECTTHTHGSISVSEIEDEFLNKTEAWMWVGAECSDLQLRLRKAGVAAAFGIYHYVNPTKAQLFMAGYRDGVGLMMGSPMLKLRNEAMTGTARDVKYWRTQAIMRAHLNGKSLDRVFEASEDMLGNKNSIHLIRARTAARVKKPGKLKAS